MSDNLSPTDMNSTLKIIGAQLAIDQHWNCRFSRDDANRCDLFVNFSPGETLGLFVLFLLKNLLGFPFNPAPSRGMVGAPIVAQHSEAPEEDGEDRPREPGPCIVPDRDQPKIDDYLNGKVPPEAVTRLSDHPRPS